MGKEESLASKRGVVGETRDADHPSSTPILSSFSFLIPGANTIRFWLHIDGSSSPDFGPDGLVSGLPPDLLPDLKWFLQRVHDHKLVTIISLWSHDILAVRRCNPVEHRERALRIFEEDAALNAYVEKALKPMLTELGTAKMTDGKTFSKAIAAWEIFNEPEEAAFDLEGNTDYMYKGAWGEYKYNNPAAFNADPRRSVDYQNISFMYNEGFIRADPNDAGDAEYNGFHFVKTWQGQVREKEEREREEGVHWRLCALSTLPRPPFARAAGGLCRPSLPRPAESWGVHAPSCGRHGTSRPAATEAHLVLRGRGCDLWPPSAHAFPHSLSLLSLFIFIRTFSTGTSTTTSSVSSTRTTTT